MKRSLSIRAFLGLSHALLLIISLGAIAIIWSRNEYRVITSELLSVTQERVTTLSNILNHEFSEHGEMKLDQAEIPIVRHEKNLLAVYIDQSGSLHELVPGSISPLQAEFFRKYSSEHTVYESSFASLVHPEFEPTSVYAAAPVFGNNNERIGIVCLIQPIGDLDSYISRLRWLLLGAIIFVAIVGVGVSFILTSYFSRQFSRAQGLAATVASGDYHLRIPEAGPTELRDLSRYLNQMAEKLQEQKKMRQTLLANVAHELARPLAGLQLGIESLRKGAIQTPDLADDLLVSMAQTIRRFGALIDDITLAAQPESHPIELVRKPLAVEPFLRGMATRFWSLAKAHDVEIKVQVADDLPAVWADEKRLNQIIGNLLDNAIKFTPPGKSVRLGAERAEDASVRLMVQDSGQGIPEEDAEHIFEPFYQGDVGRRIKQGMGLGLSIAHQLAKAHGASLVLKNHPNGGVLAILTLPVANA